MLLTLCQSCDIKTNFFDLGSVYSIDSNLSECFFPKNSNSSGQLGLCGECNTNPLSGCFIVIWTFYLKFGLFKVWIF